MRRCKSCYRHKTTVAVVAEQVANYGKGECKAWDMELDVCQVNPKPDFCSKQWSRGGVLRRNALRRTTSHPHWKDG